MSLWSRIRSYFDLRKTVDPAAARQAFLDYQQSLETPWASFEIVDFNGEHGVKVEFTWNSAFITKIRELGFHAETEDDSVQLFFYASSMRPTTLDDVDEPVQSTAHPQLTSDGNRLQT